MSWMRSIRIARRWQRPSQGMASKCEKRCEWNDSSNRHQYARLIASYDYHLHFSYWDAWHWEDCFGSRMMQITTHPTDCKQRKQKNQTNSMPTLSTQYYKITLWMSMWLHLRPQRRKLHSGSHTWSALPHRHSKY